ncbi:methyltransferase domain-containing protein [Acidimicrobiia bacterium EGI L10123]|nr:methyltransferase domain-containing protein [Acidimicrobiia bacterium EGI L10123]
MTDDVMVDRDQLRDQVRDKYRMVATEPGGAYHFHTGRRAAAHLGYPPEVVDDLPDAAVESFAGVGNPFVLRTLEPGERVVDVGSGGGFDTFIAAEQVRPEGRVIGVDMTEEMLAKATRAAAELGHHHVEVREGYAEDLPVEDGWADVVISNGVINLCPDKQAAFGEIFRALRPGGWLQFADIANGNRVPAEAMRDIDLWTD